MTRNLTSQTLFLYHGNWKPVTRPQIIRGHGPQIKPENADSLKTFSITAPQKQDQQIGPTCHCTSPRASRLGSHLRFKGTVDNNQ